MLDGPPERRTREHRIRGFIAGCLNKDSVTAAMSVDEGVTREEFISTYGAGGDANLIRAAFQQMDATDSQE